MTFVKGREDWMDIEKGEGEWEDKEVEGGGDGDLERKFNEGIRAAFMKSSGGGERISSKPIRKRGRIWGEKTCSNICSCLVSFTWYRTQEKEGHYQQWFNIHKDCEWRWNQGKGTC